MTKHSSLHPSHPHTLSLLFIIFLITNKIDASAFLLHYFSKPTLFFSSSSSSSNHYSHHPVAPSSDELLSSNQEEETLLTYSTELWLDLRGTAILPHAAVEHLHNDLWGEFQFGKKNRPTRIIDRVLISEDEVENSKPFVKEGGIDPDVLVVVDDETKEVIWDFKRETKRGEVVVLKGSVSDNPIRVLECVDKGGWVVIESGQLEDEEERKEAVENLIQFVAAVASSGTSMSGGLFLLGEEEKMRDDSDTGETGGVALTCRTKADVLQAGPSIQVLQTGSSIRMSEGGILFSEGPSVGGASRVKCAVVLPFDTMLWKTASFVFGEDVDDLDEEFEK